eukprot:gb/GEZJ01005745.1/.p1 GENE.gb/GEZJ01005745.1/~~gb/GEZJ01005745.1/.p1  ORF type:complete len:355 (+),score=27.58 gb/GEZJ01005745.1/:1062-2126(+)
MEDFCGGVGSPLQSFLDLNLVALMEGTDEQTPTTPSSPDTLTPPFCEEALLQPTIETGESESELRVVLLDLQTPLSPQALIGTRNGCDLDGDNDLLSETEGIPLMASTSVESLERCIANNESSEAGFELGAVVAGAVQKSSEMSLASELTPIPRVVQIAGAPPCLNLNAMLTGRNSYSAAFAQPFARACLSSSSKRRYYGSASSSRYCHICGRGTCRGSAAKCSNSRNGTCRKIICERCMLIHDPVNAGFGSRRNSWICTHCRMRCPSSARCHQYARNNMKRRLRNQAGVERGVTKRPRDMAEAVAPKSAPLTGACGAAGRAMNADGSKSAVEGEELVSQEMLDNMVDSFLLFP